MAKFLKERKTFKESDSVKKIDDYKTVVNYYSFFLDDDDLKKMIDYEKNVLFHQQKSKEHLLALSETLYKAQKLLANYKNGGFRDWFQALGLKKDFVYMCLKRYSLYLDYSNDKVMMIPEVIIKDISKNNLTKENIVEILNNDKPQEKYREIKKAQDVVVIDLVDSDNIEVLEKKLSEKYRNLTKLQSEIKDIEYRLDILRKRK